MKTKVLLLAVAGCLELLAGAGTAQAQDSCGRWGGHWGGRETPEFSYGGYYQPAVLGMHGPGIYNKWGTRFYGLPDYGAAMELYGYPVPVYPPYSPYASAPGGPYRGGVVDPSTTSAPITSDITTAPPANTAAAQPAAAAPGTAADKAEFRVKVPVPNAKVFFNDKLIEQEGTDRKLLTPALQPGAYSYRVRATWTENGVDKSQERTVTAQAGQVVNLAFGENRAP